MARTRRIYTPEFKAEAVKLVTEHGYSIAEAARSLAINDDLIRNWKQALQDNGEHAFPGRAKPSPFEEENRRGVLGQGGDMTYRFIDQHKDPWPVRWLCQTLGVSPASYYAWRQSPRSAGPQRHDTLLVEIRAIHAQFKARYGSPRIHAELLARGHDCCVNTVAKLMRKAGIAAKTTRKFRCTTTDADHDMPVADNLLDRQFNPSASNEAWVADITYIPTREGWLYLAAVEDPYSRRVVGWAMAEHMESRLAKGCWRIPTVAASTPATTINGCWPSTASGAA